MSANTLALAAVATKLREGEKLFAYIDDLYIICQPDRVGDVHVLLQQHLWDHTRVSLHLGKTKVWNKSGEVATPGAIVWRGDTSFLTSEQGFKVLGVPLGHPDFVERFLQKKIDEHKVLLERIPAIPDVQAAWINLSYCAPNRTSPLR